MLGGGADISITNNSGGTALLCVAAYKDNKLIDIELKQIEIVKGQTDSIASKYIYYIPTKDELIKQVQDEEC